MSQTLTIAVLLGGRSAEREVSLVSGEACATALRHNGHRVIEIDPSDGLPAMLAALDPKDGAKPDVVFNALHGRWGEDGCIQGLLELLGLRYTHSNLLASALAMDKVMAKQLFTAAGLPCAESRVATREAVQADEVMERPYVIKPVAEGSSVGVIIVQDGRNDPPLGEDWTFGEEVMVERYIPGRELTVTVMGGEALAVTELKTSEGFYDYRAKYTSGVTEHLVPAPVPKEIYRQALEISERAHAVLGCAGISRADFRYDDTGGEPGELYLLEVNTQPGMTPLSLVPEQAAYKNIAFNDLVQWLVEAAL